MDMKKLSDFKREVIDTHISITCGESLAERYSQLATFLKARKDGTHKAMLTELRESSDKIVAKWEKMRDEAEGYNQSA